MIGLGALLATLLSSSGPLPSPQPNPAPAPLPTPVPTPDREPQYRGRLQIQGSDMRRGEISWPWAQSVPLKKLIALAQLAILWGQLSKSEQNLRTEAYPDAQKFIQGGPYAIHRSWTFQNYVLPKKYKDARIDVVINKGVSFVD